MNVFSDETIAREYDVYYKEEQGKTTDQLEKKAISDLTKDIKPGNLLEIGCGTGHWTSFFSSLGFRVTATDVSQAMMSYAKEKFLPDVTFIEADVRHLPFPDNYFDQVATITALEFCGDIEKAFSEMKRVLKPSGWLITGCLNAESMLGKTKDSDPVFKHAEMMDKATLEAHLKTIGNPTIQECVFLSSDFELLDNTEKRNTVAGAFMAATVQKK